MSSGFISCGENRKGGEILPRAERRKGDWSGGNSLEGTLGRGLGIPDHVVPVAYVCMGYVSEYFEKRTSSQPVGVHTYHWMS